MGWVEWVLRMLLLLPRYMIRRSIKMWVVWRLAPRWSTAVCQFLMLGIDDALSNTWHAFRN